MADGVAAVENHEKRIGGLEVREGKAEVRLNQHDKDINSLKKNMDSVHGELNEIKVRISELEQSVKWSIRYATTVSLLLGGLVGGLIVWGVEHL